jgi:UDP-N-acetylmuramate--alanine ligase
LDHPDCFPDLDAMTAAFRAFLHQVGPQGTVIGCGEAPNARFLLEGLDQSDLGRRILTYGLEGSFDWVGSDLVVNEQGGTDFTAWHDSKPLGTINLCLPGLHNARNALATLAVSRELGVSFESAQAALSAFRGTERRFEVKGEVAGITVVDDYAHHPTQIRATLSAARRRYGERTVWAVFQPHTYSRTRALLGDYASSFEDAEHVIVMGIYAAREFDDLGISSADVVARMHHPDARHIQESSDVIAYLLPRLRPQDVLITMGAGDGYTVGEAVLDALPMSMPNWTASLPLADAGLANSDTQPVCPHR